MAKQDTISEESYNKAVFQDGGSLVVDLSGVEESAGFQLIPRGWYEAVIDNWEFGYSENSGAPMFTCTVQIEHPDYQGEKRRSYFSFSPKALPITKANLVKLSPKFAGAFNPEEIANSGEMLGMPVRVRISHRDYEGQKRDNIAEVAPRTETGGKSNGAGKSGKSYF
jgi:hypothetical protein